MYIILWWTYHIVLSFQSWSAALLMWCSLSLVQQWSRSSCFLVVHSTWNKYEDPVGRDDPKDFCRHIRHDTQNKHTSTSRATYHRYLTWGRSFRKRVLGVSHKSWLKRSALDSYSYCFVDIESIIVQASWARCSVDLDAAHTNTRIHVTLVCSRLTSFLLSLNSPLGCLQEYGSPWWWDKRRTALAVVGIRDVPSTWRVRKESLWRRLPSLPPICYFCDGSLLQPSISIAFLTGKSESSLTQWSEARLGGIQSTSGCIQRGRNSESILPGLYLTAHWNTTFSTSI